jgi:8-oxo-dGTP pyrophosphatase MutT (NUDIX family)
VTPVRPASTLVVVRDGQEGIEVVMGKRPPGGPFGDVWVFPGGAVDPEDLAVASDADEAWRLAALRETWEEVGLAITDPAGAPIPPGAGSVYTRMSAAGVRFATSRLVYLSNWVTPRIVSKRFDTRFFVVEGDGDLTSSHELAHAGWLSASEAIVRHERDGLPLMFPTVSHLRYIARFGVVADLLGEARSLDRIPAVEPRRFERGDGVELIVDNDPRFAP